MAAALLQTAADGPCSRPHVTLGRSPCAARAPPSPAPSPSPRPFLRVTQTTRPPARARLLRPPAVQRGAAAPLRPARSPAPPRKVPPPTPAAHGGRGLRASEPPAAFPKKAAAPGGHAGKAPSSRERAAPGAPPPAGAAPAPAARKEPRKRYGRSDLAGTDSQYLCLLCYEPLYVGTATMEEACLNRGCASYTYKGEISGDIAEHDGPRRARKLCLESVRRFCKFSRRFALQKIHEARAAECASLLCGDGMDITTVASMDYLAMQLCTNTAWGGSEDHRDWRAALDFYLENFDGRLFIEDICSRNYVANPRGQPFVMKYHHALSDFFKAHGIVSGDDRHTRASSLPFAHIDKKSAGDAPMGAHDFGAIYKSSLPFAGALKHVFKMRYSVSKMHGYPARPADFAALLSLWTACPPGYAGTVTASELRKVYEGAARKNRMARNFGQFLADYTSGKTHAPILIFDGERYHFDYATLLLYLVYLFSNNHSCSGTQTEAGKAVYGRMRQVAASQFEAEIRQKLRGDGFDVRPRPDEGQFRPSFDSERKEFDCVAVDRDRKIIVLVEAKYEDMAPSSTAAGTMVGQLVLDRKTGLLAHAKKHHTRWKFFKRHFDGMGQRGLDLPGGFSDYTVYTLLVTKHEPLISRHMAVDILSYKRFMSIDLGSPSARDDLDGAAGGPPSRTTGAGTAGGPALHARVKRGRHRAPAPPPRARAARPMANSQPSAPPGLRPPHCPPPRARRAMVLSRIAGQAAVNAGDPCPFCGGCLLVKGPLAERIKEAGVGIAGSGGSAKLRKSGDTYFTCNGCMKAFVDADRDIEGILCGLKSKANIAHRTRHFYGEGVTPSELLENHRTAILRKANPRRSLLGVSLARKELIICFSYNGIRTYGSFIRKGDHYIFRELSSV